MSKSPRIIKGPKNGTFILQTPEQYDSAWITQAEFYNTPDNIHKLLKEIMLRCWCNLSPEMTRTCPIHKEEKSL